MCLFLPMKPSTNSSVAAVNNKLAAGGRGGSNSAVPVFGGAGGSSTLLLVSGGCAATNTSATTPHSNSAAAASPQQVPHIIMYYSVIYNFLMLWLCHCPSFAFFTPTPVYLLSLPFYHLSLHLGTSLLRPPSPPPGATRGVDARTEEEAGEGEHCPPIS